MNKIQIVIVGLALTGALVGCSTAGDQRAATSGGGATVAATRPAEPAARPVAPPQTAVAQPETRAQADQTFRQDQRK